MNAQQNGRRTHVLRTIRYPCLRAVQYSKWRAQRNEDQNLYVIDKLIESRPQILAETGHAPADAPSGTGRSYSIT